MLDHVIIFLQKDQTILVKNVLNILLKRVKELFGFPIEIVDKCNVLEVTAKDNIIVLANGYDNNYPCVYLDIIAVRLTDMKISESFIRVLHINDLHNLPEKESDAMTCCYSSDGNFLFYNCEYASNIKSIQDNLLDINLRII